MDRNNHLIVTAVSAITVTLLCGAFLVLSPPRSLWPFSEWLRNHHPIQTVVNASPLPNSAYPLQPLSIIRRDLLRGRFDALTVFADSHPPLAVMHFRDETGTGMSLNDRTMSEIGRLTHVVDDYNARAPVGRRVRIVW